MSDGDLRRFRQDTAPSGHDALRLRDRVDAERSRGDRWDSLLRELPAPDDDGLARVRARVHADLRQPSGRPAWLPVALATLASAAATMTLLVSLHRVPELHGELSADSTLPPGLSLRVLGDGELDGTPAAPRILWRQGTLHVDVDPSAGLRVSVETPEAEAVVLGTAFSVVRGPPGTTVEVARGTVAMRCRGAEQGQRITAGGETTCAPNTAAGMLARARALQEEGKLKGALDAAAEGLKMGPSTAVRAELSLCRVEVLAAQGRRGEALTAVEQLLKGGAAQRRVDALHLALSLSGPRAPCRTVLPWLKELGAREATDWERTRLRRCSAGR